MSGATTPKPVVPRFTADQVRRRRAIALRVSVATVVVVGLLFVVVFPLQAWMRQRDDLRTSQHRLEVIHEERVRLEREAARLREPSEVERIAARALRHGAPGRAGLRGGPRSRHHHDDRTGHVTDPVAVATRSRTLAACPTRTTSRV